MLDPYPACKQVHQSINRRQTRQRRLSTHKHRQRDRQTTMNANTHTKPKKTEPPTGDSQPIHSSIFGSLIPEPHQRCTTYFNCISVVFGPHYRLDPSCLARCGGCSHHHAPPTTLVAHCRASALPPAHSLSSASHRCSKMSRSIAEGFKGIFTFAFQ
jgi:hypothetical protein